MVVAGDIMVLSGDLKHSDSEDKYSLERCLSADGAEDSNLECIDLVDTEDPDKVEKSKGL